MGSGLSSINNGSFSKAELSLYKTTWRMACGPKTKQMMFAGQPNALFRVRSIAMPHGHPGWTNCGRIARGQQYARTLSCRPAST